MGQKVSVGGVVLIDPDGSSQAAERDEKQAQARCLALIRMLEGSNVYMRVRMAWILDFAWFRDCQFLSYYVI